MKFISKLVLASLALFLSSVAAFAQTVHYSWDNERGHSLGAASITYRSNGYDAVLGEAKSSFTSSPGVATLNVGGVIMTIDIDHTFWHTHLGQWRNSPFVTSDGSRGMHRMLYVGGAPLGNGRWYREEMWLDGQMTHSVETIIDQNEQIISATARDAKGLMILRRKSQPL